MKDDSLLVMFILSASKNLKHIQQKLSPNYHCITLSKLQNFRFKNLEKKWLCS